MSTRSKLSTLWIFATVNYIYCDLVGVMDPHLLRGFLAGNVGGIEVSPAFLLGASVLVEIPMAMILLSRLLNERTNRWANVAAGAVMTIVQLGSLFAKAPASYYVFFSVIEIATTAAIAWYAWTRLRVHVRAIDTDVQAVRSVGSHHVPGASPL